MVNLESPFWIGRAEVSQSDLKLEEGKSSGGGTQPATYVSWEKATAFCDWLTARERRAGRLPAGYVYRLPTEAEWEYAARESNEVGLYDMIGGVWEWCADDWYDNFRNAPKNGRARIKPGSILKTIRGGASDSSQGELRVTARNCLDQSYGGKTCGFRVVLGLQYQKYGK